jgi:hypothetical protein
MLLTVTVTLKLLPLLQQFCNGHATVTQQSCNGNGFVTVTQRSRHKNERFTVLLYP